MRTSLFIFLFIFIGSSNCSASLTITEVLADPPPGIAGDANQDGISSTTQDEFIEFFNAGSDALNISGWTVADAIKERHVFPNNTFILPGQYLVVFGGGSPVLPGISWQTASTGSLGLNNGGDTVTLRDPSLQLVDQLTYGSIGGQNESIIKISGQWVLHSSVQGVQGGIYSPGEPTVQVKAGRASVPEAGTLWMISFGVGVLTNLKFKKQNAKLQ